MNNTNFHVSSRLAGALVTAAVSKVVVVYLKRYPTDRGYMALADGLMILYASLVCLL